MLLHHYYYYYYYHYHFEWYWVNKYWRKWQQNSLHNHVRVRAGQILARKMRRNAWKSDSDIYFSTKSLWRSIFSKGKQMLLECHILLHGYCFVWIKSLMNRNTRQLRFVEGGVGEKRSPISASNACITLRHN